MKTDARSLHLSGLATTQRHAVSGHSATQDSSSSRRCMGALQDKIASSLNLGPPASTPPPFHCLGKHSLCNIISFSSTFKIQEILFSLQTCTFLKKRRFSEDVVFQKSTSRQHGSTRFRIRRLPEATHDKPTTYRSLRSPCSWLHTGAWPS